MLRTIEAVLEKDGRLRLLENVSVLHRQRVLVTFLEESSSNIDVTETAQLSEPALAEDWDNDEENAAWRHLR